MLGGVQFEPTFLYFSRIVFSRARVKTWFFVTFNIITSYIFSENFIEIHPVVQKIWWLYSSRLASLALFWIFWYLLVAKELRTSTYNRWCQHLNLTTILSYIILNYSWCMKGKLPSKSPALIGLSIYFWHLFYIHLQRCESQQICKETSFPANIYLFKVNDKNARKRREICSKLAIKTADRRQTSFWCFYC